MICTLTTLAILWHKKMKKEVTPERKPNPKDQSRPPFEYDDQCNGWLKRLELEPYLAMLGEDGFEPADTTVSEPGKRIFIAAACPTSKFNKLARFEYWRSNSKTWWECGMQSRVSEEVTLLTDNIEDGIFVFYNMQNSPEHTAFLGMLLENPFTEKVRGAFAGFTIA